jgi:predicted nucleotidyltransferase
MRLIASEAALDLLVALDQAGEARLTNLARAADMGLSTAQRALEVLVGDGLATRTGNGTYRAVDTPTSRAAREIALHARPDDRLARIIGAANEGVELIGRTKSQLIVVSGRHADVAQRLAARRALAVLAEWQGCKLVERQHDDLRAHRADFAQERTVLAEGSVIYGNLDTVYPPVPRRGAGGLPLGRLNPALGVPTAKRLRDVSRRHGVRRLQVFGSAVRDDFRPDSDVDVAVDLEPGTPHRVLSELEEQLEHLFDRDVDVVLTNLLRDSVRREVDEHGVSLVG